MQKHEQKERRNLYCVNNWRNNETMSNLDVIMEEGAIQENQNKWQKSDKLVNKSITRIQKESTSQSTAKSSSSTPQDLHRLPTQPPQVRKANKDKVTPTSTTATTTTQDPKTPIIISEGDTASIETGKNPEKEDETENQPKGMEEHLTFLGSWPNGPTEEDKAKKTRRERMELNLGAYEEAKWFTDLEEEERKHLQKEYVCQTRKEQRKSSLTHV